MKYPVFVFYYKNTYISALIKISVLPKKKKKTYKILFLGRRHGIIQHKYADKEIAFQKSSCHFIYDLLPASFLFEYF